jgi:LmbE family N-acetylglucosaminyl deacetylase
MMKVLVFSPHPDDDLIGCGGSIAKQLKKGNEVKIVYMTSGEAGSLKYSKEELGGIREEEMKKAASFLGVSGLVFLRNADGYLEYDQDNLIKIVNIIREEKPDLIYLPHEKDNHRDHINTYKLVNDAIMRAAGPWFQECCAHSWQVKTVLCYEVWTPLQEISYVEDISDFIELKVKALKYHESQLKDINYDEAVKCLNRYRGIMTGQGRYCECFQVLKVSAV